MRQRHRRRVETRRFSGRHPCPLDDQLAFEIGRATVETLLACQPGGDSRVCRVVVGRDARLTSPTLSAALIAGLYAAGTEARRVEVSDVGRCSTEMVYFAVGTDASVAGGVMVTASHNPKDDNGFKIVKRGAEIANGEDLAAIADGVRKALTLHATQGRSWKTPPKPACRSLDVAADYAAKVIEVSGIKKDRNASLRIVVEAGSGVGGEVFRKIARAAVPASHLLAFATRRQLPCLPPQPARSRLHAAPAGPRLRRAGRSGCGVRRRRGPHRGRRRGRLGPVVLGDHRPVGGPHCETSRRAANLEIMYNLSCSRLVPHQIRARWCHAADDARGARTDQAGIAPPSPLPAGRRTFRPLLFPHFFRADSGMIAALMIIEEVMSREESQEADLHDTIAGWREKYFPFDETNFKMVGREGASGEEPLRLRDDAIERAGVRPSDRRHRGCPVRCPGSPHQAADRQGRIHARRS